ncbi:MAG: hypothetical protein MRK02_04520 [Candidatus Scalindua sp.]|nr:hypothetical protein [Candidatus Scalindua sp.]
MIPVEEIILLQIDRGADFLVAIGQKFFQDYSFDKFNKNQLHNLRWVIEGSSDFSDMVKLVNKWLDKQAERKKGRLWVEVKDSLPKVLFEWSDHEKLIKEMALNRLGSDDNLIKDGIDFLITEDNLKNGLEEMKFRLAKKLFYILITLHRCHKTDEKITARLFNFNNVKTSED